MQTYRSCSIRDTGTHLWLFTAWLVRSLWFPHTSLDLRRLAVNDNNKETVGRWERRGQKWDNPTSTHCTFILNGGPQPHYASLIRTFWAAVCLRVTCLLHRGIPERNHIWRAYTCALNSTTSPSAVHPHRTQVHSIYFYSTQPFALIFHISNIPELSKAKKQTGKVK